MMNLEARDRGDGGPGKGTGGGGRRRRLGVRGFLVALAVAVAFVAVPADVDARKKKKVVIPGDIHFERKGKGKKKSDKQYPPAVFQHWVHQIRYRCYVCHEGIFVSKKGANEITKEAMRKGENCGVCHNGRIAFEVGLQTCARCHRVE